MAIVAAGALALSACTSDSGDSGAGGDNGGSEDSEGGGSTEGSESTDGATESMAEGEMADTAKPDIGEVTTTDDEIFFSAGEVEWEAYNELTSATYSTYNSIVTDRLRETFWYFGTDGTIYPNENFGSYEVTSEDPLTVEYTISDDAVWEDGTPVTYNDFLLMWAIENPAVLFPEGEGPFDPVSTSFGEFVPEGPQGEIDGKTFTLEFGQPYPDWEILLSPPLPAHVVAEQAGMEPAALAQAILDRDISNMDAVAEFWNSGWTFADKQLPDPALVPSMGPYSLNGATWNSPESLTLVPNESYWGPPPATARYTVRFAAPETHVQALENGDINVVEPQATVDTVNQIEALGEGFTMLVGDELTWEHLDFNFAESSPFSEANGGLAAREAFAMCVPRQQIVDNLIVPINPTAEVMNLREVFPFQDNYDEVVAEAYDGRYDEVDIEGATAKLEEAGLTTPVDVRIGYSGPNQRRTDEVTAIKASCDQAGFNIIDIGDPTFFEAGGILDSGDWEVALFAWAGSGQIASGQNIYSTDAPQNYGGFSNQEVDEAWDALASSNDPEVWARQTPIIEKLLWDNLFGIPLFAHPGVVAHDASIQNVVFNSTQSGIPWNADQWVRAE